MKIFIRGILLMVILSVTAAGQTGRVNGKVFLPDGEPAIGADVYISGDNIRTKADIDGEYVLNIPPGTHTVTAEYIGYLDTSITFTIDVDQKLNIDLLLDEFISARGARRDIENGDIRIIFSGGLMVSTSEVPIEEETKLTSEYGFRYEYSCDIYSKAAEDEYNSEVYAYLDRRNGKNWHKQFSERYNELKKHYNKSPREDSE